MSDTKITIDTEYPIGRINPRVYGHFAEHLGRCCYDGLRPDPSLEGKVATKNGFRTDVIDALRAMPVPLLRWPGGCYADHYHWRDGIGPAEQRNVTLGMSCGLKVEDDNSLGTHEFMWLCNYLGAEPYLAGNLSSGTVQEMCDWLEYCNTPLNTRLGAERRANGAPEPFGVKLWGVGNENWGCGGNFDPITYAHEYRRYATNMRHVDESAELVLCGHTNEWNVDVLAGMGNQLGLVDHLSIHRYWIHGGPETAFSPDEYYGLLAEADDTENFILQTDEIIRDALGKQNSGKRTIGIALDEWGVWHPEAREWGPGANSRLPQTYEQAGTLRDALATAAALEGFHRQCNILTLANLAQIVNVLHAPVMTDGDRMWLTPTYHVLQMHKPHVGAKALPVTVDGGESTPTGSAVTATASRSGQGVAVTVMNRHLAQEAAVVLAGIVAGAHVKATVLTGENAAAVNSVDAPEAVALHALDVATVAGGYRIVLPPHSVATVIFG